MGAAARLARDARIALSGKTFDIDRLVLQSAWNGEYARPVARPGTGAARGRRRVPARPDADGVAGPETLMALAGDAPGPSPVARAGVIACR